MEIMSNNRHKWHIKDILNECDGGGGGSEHPQGSWRVTRGGIGPGGGNENVTAKIDSSNDK